MIDYKNLSEPNANQVGNPSSCEPNPRHDLVFIFGSSADSMSEHNGTTIDSPIKYMTDMQELYRFTERQFLEFDEIVPMRLNRKGDTVSPKLYFLLMTICGQVESVTGRICKSLDIRAESDTFSALYKKLCEEFSTTKEQSVQTVMTREVIRPFGETENDTPSWWTSYNKVKHDIPKGIERATVRHTIHALGGLYLLLNFYQSIPCNNPKDILDAENWFSGNPTPRLPSNRFGYVPDVDYKSSLFILKSHFMQSG